MNFKQNFVNLTADLFDNAICKRAITAVKTLTLTVCNCESKI